MAMIDGVNNALASCPQCGEERLACWGPVLERREDKFLIERWCLACYAQWWTVAEALMFQEACGVCGHQALAPVTGLCVDMVIRDEEPLFVFSRLMECEHCRFEIKEIFEPVSVEMIHPGGKDSPLYRELNGEVVNG